MLHENINRKSNEINWYYNTGFLSDDMEIFRKNNNKDIQKIFSVIPPLDTLQSHLLSHYFEVTNSLSSNPTWTDPYVIKFVNRLFNRFFLLGIPVFSTIPEIWLIQYKWKNLDSIPPPFKNWLTQYYGAGIKQSIPVTIHSIFHCLGSNPTWSGPGVKVCQTCQRFLQVLQFSPPSQNW